MRVRIGTRGSPLALRQTEAVRDALAAVDAQLAEPGAVEIVVIRTTGDTIQDRPLADIGGKGLFTREIDEAMLEGRIDLAVHSVKDLPTWLPCGIVLGATLPREDPRDVLIAAVGRIADLPDGAVVGTASLRRQAQLLARRPDLRVIPLRGNVQTRLRKLETGDVAATLLAYAGLRRLGLAHAGTVLDIVEMLPAVGQGAIGVTCRADDAPCRDLLTRIDDPATAIEVTAERAMLAVLDGSCRTPIGGLARCAATGNTLALKGVIARPDGTRLIIGERTGEAHEAHALGEDLGQALRRDAGPDVFAP